MLYLFQASFKMYNMFPKDWKCSHLLETRFYAFQRKGNSITIGNEMKFSITCKLITYL